MRKSKRTEIGTPLTFCADFHEKVLSYHILYPLTCLTRLKLKGKFLPISCSKTRTTQLDSNEKTKQKHSTPARVP